MVNFCVKCPNDLLWDMHNSINFKLKCYWHAIVLSNDSFKDSAIQSTISSTKFTHIMFHEHLIPVLLCIMVHILKQVILILTC